MIFEMGVPGGNELYNTEFEGVINLGTVLKAPAVATNGHFYRVSPRFAYSSRYRTSNIYDHSDNRINPTTDRDNPKYDIPWVGVQEELGITLQSNVGYQLSYMTEYNKN